VVPICRDDTSPNFTESAKAPNRSTRLVTLPNDQIRLNIPSRDVPGYTSPGLQNGQKNQFSPAKNRAEKGQFSGIFMRSSSVQVGRYRFGPMLRRITIVWALAAALIWLLPISASMAQTQNCDANCAKRLVDTGVIMSLSQIIVTSGVSQRGEIVDNQLFQRNGRWFYGIRLLNKAENNVFGVFVDAQTGAVVPRP